MESLAIVLVSEQTIPNVLFLKWFLEKNISEKKVLFVSTDKMENRKKSESIKKVFGNIETDTIIVDENSVLKIQEKLKECDVSNYEEILVNITGGNKLMSSAAFLFFRDKAKIYYQEFSNTNALIDLKTDKKIELNQKITLKEYFAAYGIKANLNEYKKLKPNCKEYKDYFTLLNESETEDSLKELRKFRDKSKDKIQKIINENDKIKTMITSFGFDIQSITKYEIRYITGGWFEEFIFENIKEEEKAIGIKIDNTNNELDVVFINDKYELNIIECKSTATNEILSETLYKSRAITKDFGLKTNAIIYTTSKICLLPNERC
ncbi:hypothetical protein AGMMS49938_18520 [Fibrobacterales bacterium]|nr:hypothetical protein AGMMS49938_18520 [Fibrobacterales bacterium]